ncbi:glucose-1-phosphate cytidylyltransferase [Allocatelliglobosispora scoriae]|uniref:Glucose-1-phosphate cytidylyltransferase n=1 Tax=Allocatelliglobosispora scoriae TaxID=643052 RepID=A0A841BX45_9ACTN|nr:glucose-1-phosphate cytidylyltransferase [Allocatelliglobosispora scoriae]MBB5872086.1 glucose-1-phosphate cytidylyltransferase [Allocatelliglobosispora scoriae]
MKVVLFCGGFGLRMREGQGSAPKPMSMIGDRPLLWHIMRYYAFYGHTEFILCLGYGAAAVKDYFLHYDETLSNDFTLTSGGRDLLLHSTDITEWKITFIDTGLRATIGERLSKVRPYIGDDEIFLANYADTLTDVHLPDLISRFRASDATASMLAVPVASTHHVVEFGDDGIVTEVRELRDANKWENGGYFVMRPGIFDALRDGEDMVPHAFTRLADKGQLMAQRHEGFWRAADTFKDRAELEEMFHTGHSPWMVWDAQRGGSTHRNAGPQG